MSIIYGKNQLNETIIIPIVSDKSSSRTRSNSNYEVLLPIVFVILFVLVLFLIYAYNNLNLKQFLIDNVCCWCSARRRRRRRRWRYAHYDPQYHLSHGTDYMNQLSHVSQFQKSIAVNQSSMLYQTQNFGN